MRDRIHPSWENIIKNTTKASYFDALTVFIEEEYKSMCCYPESDTIFAAFDLCPLNELKVVLLGQDPYHGPGQAQGLSFSVPEGMKHRHHWSIYSKRLNRTFKFHILRVVI